MSALWMGVIAHLWQTTLVLGLIAVLARVLRRAPARCQEGLWTAGLLKLLVPLPLLAAILPALQRVGAAAEAKQSIGPAVRTLSGIAYPEMLWMGPLETGGGGLPRTFIVAATGLWILGVVTLVGLWWRRSRTTLPAGHGPWHASADVLERIARAARAANVPLNRIRVTEQTMVPCVRNVRRPFVLISHAVVERLTVEELQAVLVHEDAHRRRGDLWRRLAQGIATCVYFFYPPAWWLERRLRQSAEMACDEAVLAAGIEPRTYARALARTVDLELASTPAPALGSGANLRQRLQRIRNPERYVIMSKHRLAVAVAFVAALAWSFVPVADGSGLVTTVAGPQESGQWLPAERLSGLNGLETLVDLTYRDAPVAEVLQGLGERAGFDVYFTSQADLALKVQVAVSGTSVRDVLALLANLRGVEYRVVDPQTLIVRLRQEARLVRRVDQERRRASGDEGARDEPVVIRRAPEAGPVRVGGDIQEPERIHYVAPEYPEEARRARLEGFVILQAIIDRQGNVRDAEVLRGLDLSLDQAALEAVRQWKYTPSYYNGEAVEVIVTVNVVFRLMQ